MTTPTPKPGILDISPYVPGGAGAPGVGKVYKIASNESALGPSPKAMEAHKAVAGALHLYPNGSAAPLREAIADLYDLDASRIICGAGSDEILQLICRAYVGEGDNTIQSEFGFLVYALATKACSGEIRFAPERNLKTDVDEILGLVDDRTRIVFIANPNNPTGSYIPDSDIRRLRAELRDDVLLVIDAAYAEYMEESDYDPGAAMVDAHDNVVMTRTFSKIYGLGGLRIGWGYFPAAIADVIHRIRGPFNVNAPAIAAGVAALGDTAFVEENRAHNRSERNWLQQQLRGMGLTFVPSYGNFVLVRFPDAAGLSANDIQEHLRKGGVIVREMHPYKLGEWLRISIGPKEANRRCVELLAEKFGPDA